MEETQTRATVDTIRAKNCPQQRLKFQGTGFPRIPYLSVCLFLSTVCTTHVAKPFPTALNYPTKKWRETIEKNSNCPLEPSVNLSGVRTEKQVRFYSLWIYPRGAICVLYTRDPVFPISSHGATRNGNTEQNQQILRPTPRRLEKLLMALQPCSSP
jgi:hypothetical protein